VIQNSVHLRRIYVSPAELRDEGPGTFVNSGFSLELLPSRVLWVFLQASAARTLCTAFICTKEGKLEYFKRRSMSNTEFSKITQESDPLSRSPVCHQREENAQLRASRSSDDDESDIATRMLIGFSE